MCACVHACVYMYVCVCVSNLFKNYHNGATDIPTVHSGSCVVYDMMHNMKYYQLAHETIGFVSAMGSVWYCCV